MVPHKHDKHDSKTKKASKPTKKAVESHKEPVKAAKTAVKATPIKEVSKGKERKGKGCTEEGCHKPQIAEQYCRLHYIKNWSNIISNRRAQARANLNKYIENLSEKYPDEYMEKIRDDLGSEGAFHARLRELGFREEYESGGDNPFQMENFDEFVHGLKFED